MALLHAQSCRPSSLTPSSAGFFAPSRPPEGELLLRARALLPLAFSPLSPPFSDHSRRERESPPCVGGLLLETMFLYLLPKLYEKNVKRTKI